MENYYCHNCNSKIKLEFNYCTNCGAELIPDKIITFSPFSFCSRCLDETLPESTGNLNMYNFIGTTLINMGYKCDVCNSYVAKKCFVFAGIPIMLYGNFRILKLSESNILISKSADFYSRKIKDQKKYKL